MNNVNVSNVDEADLEDELEQLQQEQLDEAMLKTGTVPVSDAVHHLPAAAEGPRKFSHGDPVVRFPAMWLTVALVKGKAQAVEEDDEEAELRKLQAEMAM
jgi:charged multivesicular body protein 4